MNYLAKGKKTRGQGVLIEHGVSLLCVGHFIHLLAPSIDRSESCEPVGTICPVLSSTPFSTHSIHQRAWIECVSTLFPSTTSNSSKRHLLFLLLSNINDIVLPWMQVDLFLQFPPKIGHICPSIALPNQLKHKPRRRWWGSGCMSCQHRLECISMLRYHLCYFILWFDNEGAKKETIDNIGLWKLIFWWQHLPGLDELKFLQDQQQPTYGWHTVVGFRTVPQLERLPVRQQLDLYHMYHRQRTLSRQ